MILSLFLLGGYAVAVIPVMARAATCGCGKVRQPWLWKYHKTLPWLWYIVIVHVLFVLVAVIGGEWGVAAVYAGWGIRWWLAVYYHEKDKWRKAARAAGRVIVTATGRLRVAPA